MASIEETTVGGDRRPPTDARFGMRTLLVTMASVAIAATLAGFVLRRLSNSAQVQAIAIFIVVSALMIGCLLNTARTRRRLERLAGEPRFVLPPHSYLLPRAPQWVTRIVGIIALLLGTFSLAMAGVLIWQEPTRHVSPSILWNGFWALSACSFGISALWWSRAVRLCDGGLLEHHRFVPWNKLQRYYWDACYRDVIVLDTWLAVRVSAEHRTAVETFVSERLAATRDVSDGGGQNGRARP